MRLHSEIRELLRVELAGIPHTLEDGGKHPRVRIGTHPDGKGRMFVLPSTPGEYRGLLNLRADIRRYLKEANIVRSSQALEDIQEQAAEICNPSEADAQSASLHEKSTKETDHKDELSKLVADLRSLAELAFDRLEEYIERRKDVNIIHNNIIDRKKYTVLSEIERDAIKCEGKILIRDGNLHNIVYRVLAKQFSCSPSTIRNVLTEYKYHAKHKKN